MISIIQYTKNLDILGSDVIEYKFDYLEPGWICIADHVDILELEG